MAILFKHGSALRRMDSVWSLTFEHGRNLGVFAGIYKGVSAVLSRLRLLPPNLRAMVAGAVAGRLVWARYTPVNYQIVLYLLSRVAVGGAMRAGTAAGLSREWPFERVYPLLATAVWAGVMHLFEHDPGVLHPSLASSMNFIYDERQHWRQFCADAALRQAGAIVAAYTAYSLALRLLGMRPGGGGGGCCGGAPPPPVLEVTPCIDALDGMDGVT